MTLTYEVAFQGLPFRDDLDMPGEATLAAYEMGAVPDAWCSGTPLHRNGYTSNVAHRTDRAPEDRHTPGRFRPASR